MAEVNVGYQWVIGAGASLAMLAWLGAWVELALLKTLSPWYFGWGPVLFQSREVTAAMPHEDELIRPLRELPYLAARPAGPGVILIRRRFQLGPLRVDIPPIWSWRMRVVAQQGRGSRGLSLELRHGLAWPTFVLLPVPFAAYAAASGRSVSLLLFVFACLLLGGTLVLLSIRVARRDADRVWRLLTAGGVPCRDCGMLGTERPGGIRRSTADDRNARRGEAGHPQAPV